MPLPGGWRKIIKSGVAHAVALASVARQRAWSPAARSQREVQVVARLDGAKAGITFLGEELSIKDARWNGALPRR